MDTGQSKDLKPDRRKGERRRLERRDLDLPLVLEWSDEFGTGIRAIDNDHKELFEEFKTLHEQYARQADFKAIAWIVTSVFNYVNSHFEREERFMAEAGYPYLEAHKAEHRTAKRLIHELKELYEEQPEKVDGKKVVNWLSQWLTSHIVGTDMDYVPYLRGEIDTEEELELTQADEELASLEFTLPRARAEVVEDFVKILLQGGRVADALTEAVQQVARKNKASIHSQAVSIFCKE